MLSESAAVLPSDSSLLFPENTKATSLRTNILKGATKQRQMPYIFPKWALKQTFLLTFERINTAQDPERGSTSLGEG